MLNHCRVADFCYNKAVVPHRAGRSSVIDTEEHEILLTPKYLDWLDHALLVAITVQSNDCIQPS